MTPTPTELGGKLNPFGISPSTEHFIQLPSGNYLVFENAKTNPEGTDYVRIVAAADGAELVYWSHTEWGEEPMSCMGAIMGAAAEINNHEGEEAKFYRISPDVHFPKTENDIQFMDAQDNCPHCHSKDIENHDGDHDGILEVTCHTCGNQWSEPYEGPGKHN